MQDYTIKDLSGWNKKIEELAKHFGLDFYEQEFEICNYEDMLCYEAYSGMPSHYPHWSYGKAYEKKKTFYKYNLTGLPYEMVINSNPCIAYLMRDNSLLLQILTMAHVYGHNDFFKNNRLFKLGTRADYTIEMFKNHADRIRGYIQDPSIGYEKVERILDAAHALRFHTGRIIQERKLSRDEQRRKKMEMLLRKDKDRDWTVELSKLPLEPEDNILFFIRDNAGLEGWAKDIITIVVEESKYFIPQIETKIMNEGWASYWHYRILNELQLPQDLYMEFLRRHNMVIRPYLGQVNPYYLGYKIFKSIEKNFNNTPDKIFEARETERDESFIRRYLTYDICKDMNLFEYREIRDSYFITEVSDKKGWKEIRNSLCKSAGTGRIPSIRVVEMSKQDNTLVIEHEFEGRELLLSYAEKTMRHISNLWRGNVVLYTVIDGRKRMLKVG